MSRHPWASNLCVAECNESIWGEEGITARMVTARMVAAISTVFAMMAGGRLWMTQRESGLCLHPALDFLLILAGHPPTKQGTGLGIGNPV